MLKPPLEELTVWGSAFNNLKEAAVEFTQALKLIQPWNGNLDAFDDILHGGFGTPDEGFTLVWKDSELSRIALGHEETARWYERTLTTCHHANVPELTRKLEQARHGEGLTLFDWLVEIIRSHEAIILRLE